MSSGETTPADVTASAGDAGADRLPRFGSLLPPLAWVDELVAPLLDRRYLDGLAERPLDDIWIMRSRCTEAEVVLSFLRRVVQGRLDLVGALLEARRAGRPTPASSVVELLPAIMAKPLQPGREDRLVGPFAPDTDSAELSSSVAAILDVEHAGELFDAGEAELASILARTDALEVEISTRRRLLHGLVDELRREVVDRYKSRRASIDDLLS